METYFLILAWLGDFKRVTESSDFEWTVKIVRDHPMSLEKAYSCQGSINAIKYLQ